MHTVPSPGVQDVLNQLVRSSNKIPDKNRNQTLVRTRSDPVQSGVGTFMIRQALEHQIKKAILFHVNYIRTSGFSHDAPLDLLLSPSLASHSYVCLDVAHHISTLNLAKSDMRCSCCED